MSDHYKFINTPLPYAYDALEPYIDELTMHLHHDRHLQAYTDKLNELLADYPQLHDMSPEQLIRYSGRLPSEIAVPVSRNAGGVYNHRFYFNAMSPQPQRSPSEPLAKAIRRAFGGLNGFKERFKDAALSVFGSGYAWLAADSRGRLFIVPTVNQQTPLTRELIPIVNIDVWEHAYYLKHYNERGKYIDDWFTVMDWKRAGELYAQSPRRPAPRQ